MSRQTLMKYGVLCAGLTAVAGPASAITTVDVMVLYDKTLESKSVAPSLRAATMVAYANTALENSKADHRYRLVHTEAINIPAVTQTDSTALRALTNSPKAAELRKQYGADMVAMITPPKKYCGVGWMGRGSNGTLQSSSKYGHSVVNYYCTSSFGHELGHNLGLGHSPRQNSQGGVYKWGRGHGVDNLFVTMMAYTSAYGAGRLPYFSTPAVHDCKGEPCGVPVSRSDGADSTRAMNGVTQTVAAWMPTKVTDGNGNSQGGSSGSGNTGGTTGGTGGGTTATSSNLISNGSLESLAGWTVGNGSAELKLSGESVDGNHSLLVNQRSKARRQRSGALADVGALDVTGTYQFSAWLRLDDSSVKSRRNGVAYLLVKSKNGRTYRQRLGKLSVVKGQWTNMKTPSFKLKRKIASKGIDSAQLFIYTGGRDDFLLDAVELKAKSAG